MTTEPGMRFGAVWAWPATGGIWRYLPCAPSPQRGDSGRANVTVIEAGGMVMLTVGARLGVDEAELTAARRAIALHQNRPDAEVDLRPAEAVVTGATLRIVEASGDGRELAAARPSNLPPYAAAFSAMLTGDAAAAAKAAMEKGKLVVRYEVSLPKRVSVTAKLRGRWQGEGSVDDALEKAQLTIEMLVDDTASEALIAKVMQRARHEAEVLARRIIPAPNVNTCSPDTVATGIAAEVSETEVVQQVLSLQGDVAAWLK
jgi:hypothetical protein